MTVLQLFDRPGTGEALGDVVQAWEQAQLAAGCVPYTVQQRRNAVFRLERERAADPRWVTTAEVQWYLARPMSPATRATYFRHLRAWFEFLVETRRLKESPLGGMRKPRQPKSRPRPISTAQLLAGLETAAGDVLAWILLGAFQALRVTEAASVRGEHTTGGQLRVLGKGGSDKTIPLHPRVAGIVAGRPVQGWWFPGRGGSGHITAHTISERTIAHFEAAGVEDFTFHRLRHWCGTEMLRAGADLREVQEYLRHDSITSTQIYTEVLQDRLAAAALRLPLGEVPA